MNFKRPFQHFLSKFQTETSASQSAQPTGWEEVAALKTDDSETSFDDLAEVPFAGDTSVTAESVTPEASMETVGDNPETDNVTGSPELQAFKEFFKADLRIKRELAHLAPNPSDDYDESSRIDYADQAYKSLINFEPEFSQIATDFHFDEATKQSLGSFFQREREYFALDHYDYGVTQDIYQNVFSGMRHDFVEQVKTECVGYLIDKDLPGLVDSAETINELLHACHSYIMSDDEFLQKIPALANKRNAFGGDIVLRGNISEAAQQIFDSFSSDLDVGDTDIIATDNNIMMMVRDRGHALTLSATPDNEHADRMWVEYHVPKICNRRMIEALPGLDGYTDNGASGRFSVPKASFGAQIVDFISQVPTDGDMSSPGGALYKDAA